MKITKHGKLPEDKVYATDCDHCGTEFEFEQKEAKYNFDQRDGDYLSIDCPVCRRQVTIGVKR